MSPPTPSLSPEIFDYQLENFRRLVKEHPESEGPFTDFRSGLVARHEGYKDNIHEEAQKRLAIGSWREAEIGTGRLLDRVIEAIEIQGDEENRNNLVHWEPRRGEDSRAHRKLLEAREDRHAQRDLERILFDLYTREMPEAKAFEALAERIGRRYDVLAYLFFILDKQRFLPISTRAFERALELLEIPLALSQKASWANYQDYLARIRAVQEQLARVVPGTRLLDAHSFCWILARQLEKPATRSEVSESIDKLDFERDARRFPGRRELDRFLAGWKRASEKDHSGDDRERLTWENLGYQLGRDRRNWPKESVDHTFDLARRIYLEEKLAEEMENLYRRIGLETGQSYPSRFLAALRNHGGVAYAKRLLASKSGVTDRFEKLVSLGRADLTVEALVTGEQFQSLFTAEELATAQNRLAPLPTTVFPATVDAELVYPETLGTDIVFHEGHTKIVTVNRHERNAKARAACLRHHGTQCAVCDLDFSERYGEIGEGFIHVHHRHPLALRRAKYRVDPEKDLVPVCPNCHAMLHKKNPPMEINELRALLRD